MAEAGVVKFCAIVGYIKVSALGQLTVHERGVIRVMWPSLEFYILQRIFGTAKATDYKFCALFGHKNYSPSDDQLFLKWAWSGPWRILKFYTSEICLERLVKILCACRLCQMLAFGRLTIPERGVARVTWSTSEFYNPLNSLGWLKIESSNFVQG